VIESLRRSRVWWCVATIPELGRLRQEDCKLEASQGYLIRPYHKERKENKIWGRYTSGMKKIILKILLPS
jgi:hypothetical protein